MKYFVMNHARKMLALFTVLLTISTMSQPPTIMIAPQVFIVGIVLAVPLILVYRTEKAIYAALFGVVLPWGLSLAFDSGNIRSQIGMDYLLVSSCLGSGIFFPFSVFKKTIANMVGV